VRARPLLKAGYYSLLSALGAEQALWRHRAAADGTALVLNFHRVSPERNPYWPPMTPDQLDRLLTELRRHCDVVTFAQLSTPGDGRPRVVLSFDDGHRDFVEYALPILDTHGLRVNHNLIATAVELGDTPWMTQVVDALHGAAFDQVRALRIPGCGLRLERDDDHSKAMFGARLTAWLKLLTRVERAERCTELQHMIDGTDRFTPMMTRRDALSIVGRHEIGAHSVEHETLSLLGEADFLDDIDGSERFMARLGLPMRIFAFPHGMHAPGQVELLRAHGVEHVLLVEEAPTRVDRGVYARITMYGDTDAELRIRALGYRAPTLAGRRIELGAKPEGG
jgi:peptidoglycan/xylan/chitin deacetylase (PgdA/CDA1 family)